MIEQELKTPQLIQRLAADVFLGEILLFPEFSRLGNNPQEVQRALQRDLRRWLDDLPSVERLQLYQRWTSHDLTPLTCALIIPPPRGSAAWQEPVELEFYGVSRPIRDGMSSGLVAFFPSLGIEVLADSEKELAGQCEHEVGSALQRMKAARSLASLSFVQRTEQLEVELSEQTTAWHSLKKTVRMEERGEEDTEGALLKEVASPLSQARDLHPAYEYRGYAQQMIDRLAAKRPASVLLVGRSGVGKTALVRDVVTWQADSELAGRTLWTTDGSRLMSGTMGFGMWQQRCQELWRVCAEQKAILHVGSLVELMEVGKCEGQTQGVASFLRPYIARGDLQVIAECTPEQVAMIERQSPQLLAAFERLEIAEPEPEVERKILEQTRDRLDVSVRLDEKVIGWISALHRRYATYSATPGRPIRFMKNLLADSAAEEITAADVTRAFAKETGLPLSMLDPDAPLDYEQTLGWFSERVIGQSDAVTSVTDVLMTLKANLNRERRPLASLLFVGPTGVGKTELAKTLARFLFGSERRLIRIDMSEYADGLGVQRLIGGITQSEGVLTSRVREQPFSVVLLDEFEKAHPLFFDLLLQVLGDGRLTDGQGRLADFRNSVIIMTSNLGTSDFAARSAGFDTEKATREVESHFRKAVEAFVRPELYNRIDRVIPFRPLDHETAKSIIAREIELLRRRDGLRFRPVKFEVSDGVVARLREWGFEPQYGARSLKRVMEQQIMIPLAAMLNRHRVDQPVVAEVRLDEAGDAIQIEVHSQEHVAEQVEQRTSYAVLDSARDLRRYWQSLCNCSATQAMRDQLYRLERREQKLSRRRKISEEATRTMEARHRLQGRLEQVLQAGDGLVSMEDQMLLKLCLGDAAEDAAGAEQHERISSDPQQQGAQVIEWRRHLAGVAQDVHAFSLDEPNVIRMFLHGGSREAMARLCRSYLFVAKQMGAEMTLWQFRHGEVDATEERWSLDELHWRDSVVPRDQAKMYDAVKWLVLQDVPLERQQKYLQRFRVRNIADFLDAAVPKGTIGVYVQLVGPLVFPRFVNEMGLHEFSVDEDKTHVRVATEEPPIGGFLPPWMFQRQRFTTRQVRRKYRAKSIEDPTLKKKVSFAATRFDEFVAELLFLQHQKLAWGVAYQ